jgi:hypothetical protein
MQEQTLIYNLLSEYKLDDQTSLQQRIQDLSITDWITIIEKLDAWYKQCEKEPSPETKINPLTFTFPVLPPQLLPSISSHLLIADVAWLDDPLFDSLVTLEAYMTGSNFAMQMARKNTWGYNKLLENIESYIRFYLQSKDLVLERRLVPFKDMNTPFSGQVFAENLLEQVMRDKDLLQTLGFPYHFRWAKFYSPFVRLLNKRKSSEKLAKRVDFPQFVDGFMQTAPIIVSFAMFGLYGSRGLSTDFISADMARLYRFVLNLTEVLNKSLPPDDKIQVPLTASRQTPNILLIENIPLERVLDAYSMEKDALINYRASLNEKLLQISAPPGSIEWEREIARIQESIRKDLADITIVHKTLKANFIKRFSVNLLLSTFGVVVTGLGTSGQNLNAIAIASSVAGGTAIVAGLKEIAKEWLDYQKETQFLRSRENFFIWKLRSGSSNK